MSSLSQSSDSAASRIANPSVPLAVAKVWRYRDRIELEAAELFRLLGEALGTMYGEGDEVSRLCHQASADERRHSVLCREILSRCDEEIPVYSPKPMQLLGPAEASLRQRVLYTAVAVGCITETLSTSLLIAMRKKAGPEIIQKTVQEILEDEITHSRIGWAELSRAVQYSDVSWLKPHVAPMIRTAFAEDVKSMLLEGEDYSAWGILPRSAAKSIMEEAVDGVVYPGLKRMGVW